MASSPTRDPHEGRYCGPVRAVFAHNAKFSERADTDPKMNAGGRVAFGLGIHVGAW